MDRGAARNILLMLEQLAFNLEHRGTRAAEKVLEVLLDLSEGIDVVNGAI